MSFVVFCVKQPGRVVYQVLRMNQSKEGATKRVFCIIIWYNNVVGDSLLDFLAVGRIVLFLVTGFFYILIIALLRELIVFSYMLQFYCTSMGLFDESATYIYFKTFYHKSIVAFFHR